MIHENRESVSLNPFVSVLGEICICHVIFAGKGKSSNMAPKEAVDNIENLLISCTEKGSQDHNSLLAVYKCFDKYLDQNNTKRPVVLLSNGQTSRFNDDVLKFLQDHQIGLFLSPPDTTGLTQLLDQINQKLHQSYKNTKQELVLEAQV